VPASMGSLGAYSVAAPMAEHGRVGGVELL
jgi:hypothetical protein